MYSRYGTPLGPGADLALTCCTAALTSSNFAGGGGGGGGGVVVEFSRGAAGHTRPADSLRDISLSGLEFTCLLQAGLQFFFL